jgi:hypothetical protein
MVASWALRPASLRFDTALYTATPYACAYNPLLPSDPVTRSKIVLLPADEAAAREILDEGLGLEVRIGGQGRSAHHDAWQLLLGLSSTLPCPVLPCPTLPCPALFCTHVAQSKSALGPPSTLPVCFPRLPSHLTHTRRTCHRSWVAPQSCAP